VVLMAMLASFCVVALYAFYAYSFTSWTQAWELLDAPSSSPLYCTTFPSQPELPVAPVAVPGNGEPVTCLLPRLDHGVPQYHRVEASGYTAGAFCILQQLIAQTLILPEGSTCN